MKMAKKRENRYSDRHPDDGEGLGFFRRWSHRDHRRGLHPQFPDFRAGEKPFKWWRRWRVDAAGGRNKAKLCFRPIALRGTGADFLGGQQNYEAYYRWESRTRKRYGYPPFYAFNESCSTHAAAYLNKTELEEILLCFQRESSGEQRVFWSVRRGDLSRPWPG